MKNGNGIRLTFVIPCQNINTFLAGKQVQVWPTAQWPMPNKVGDSFPEGGTPIRIDPDKVKVLYANGIFTIQMKGGKRTKTITGRNGRASLAKGAKSAKPKAKPAKSHRAYVGYKDKNLGLNKLHGNYARENDLA